jgi:hypothetical protein
MKIRIRVSTRATQERQKMKKTKFPAGWNEQRVRRVLEHYEQQTDGQAVADDEAAFEDSSQTVMEVPRDLVPTIRTLIAKYKRSQRA